MPSLDNAPEIVKRYFKLDAERDVEGIVALFGDDATVIDEGEARAGLDAIRGWRTGAASEYEYTTTVTGSEALGEGRYRVTGRLEATSRAAPSISTTTSPSGAIASGGWRSRRSVASEALVGTVSSRPDRLHPLTEGTSCSRRAGGFSRRPRPINEVLFFMRVIGLAPDRATTDR